MVVLFCAVWASAIALGPEAALPLGGSLAVGVGQESLPIPGDGEIFWPSDSPHMVLVCQGEEQLYTAEQAAALNIVRGAEDNEDEHFRWPKVESSDAIPLLLITGLLIATDEQTQPIFDRAFASPQAAASARILNRFGDEVGVLGFNALMYWLGDDEEEDAAILAFSAAIGASVATGALKRLTGRERPAQSGNRTIFHGPFQGVYESFPSGDTTAAFAMARVYAKKFPKWKYVFYALAAGTAYARIQRQRHFLSDTFAGALIGLYFGKVALTNEGVILKWSIWHW